MRRFIGTLVLSLLFYTGFVSAQTDSLDRLNELCRNLDPIDPWDSLHGPRPALDYAALKAVLSPDSAYLAFVFENHLAGSDYEVVVYDRWRRSVVRTIQNVSWPRWSKNGKKLLTSYVLFDIEHDTTMDLPVQGDFQETHWTPQGEYIYYINPNGLFRSSPDGSNVEYMPDYGLGASHVPISATTWLSIYTEGTMNVPDGAYVLWDIATGRRDTVYLSELLGMHQVINATLSPNGRYIAADFHPPNGGVFSGIRYLGIIDLLENRMQKVLHSQVFGNEYFPSWTMDGSLIVSFVCRIEKTYTVWEIDTNGIFLQRLLGRQELDKLTGIRDTLVLENAVLDFEIFPQPATIRIQAQVKSMPGTVVSLHLYDIYGREIRTRAPETLDLKTGESTVSFDTADLPAGVYLVGAFAQGTSPVMRKALVRR